MAAPWRRRPRLGRPHARTEGPAIAALRANRVVPKVSPEMVGSLLRGNDFGGNPQEGGGTILPCQRIALYPEGKEGEQYSPRDVHSISYLSTTQPAGRGEQYSHDRGQSPIPSGGGKPEWGSPQNRRRQFCGVPGRRGNNTPRETYTLFYVGARRHSVRASSRVPLSNVFGRAKYAELCCSTKGLYSRRGWV